MRLRGRRCSGLEGNFHSRIRARILGDSAGYNEGHDFLLGGIWIENFPRVFGSERVILGKKIPPLIYHHVNIFEYAEDIEKPYFLSDCLLSLYLSVLQSLIPPITFDPYQHPHKHKIPTHITSNITKQKFPPLNKKALTASTTY